MDEEQAQIVAEQHRTPGEIAEQFATDYPIEVIDSPESPRLAEVAALDAEIFAGQKSLSEDDFRDIVSNGGFVLGHTDRENRMITEASVVLHASEHGGCSLEKALPEWLAYCDGAAVVKNYRGKGLQKQLLLAREGIAQEHGKEASSASVRQNNVTSIKSMLRVGYMMIADAPHYYGDEPADARVVMLKDFEIGNPLNDLDSDEEGLETSLKGIVALDNVASRLSEGAAMISLEVTQGDEVDLEYNSAVAMLLRAGYVGVGCDDIDVGDSDSERSDAMTFVRIDSLPQEIADKIRARQQEIQAIVGG